MPIKSDLLRSAGIGTQPNRTTKFQLLKRKAQQQKKPSFLTGLGKTLSLTAAGMKDPAAVPKIINDMKRRRMEAKLNQARIAKLRSDINQPDPYKNRAAWEKKDAIGTLFFDYLKNRIPAYKESGEEYKGAKWNPLDNEQKVGIAKRVLEGNYNKDELNEDGELKLKVIMDKLGINRKDWYSWSMKNRPTLSEYAFPGQTYIEKQKRNK